MSANKWVFLSSEVEAAENHVGGDWDAVRGLLGGKGANLAGMTRLGVPVPPSFTITTEACNSFLEAGEQFPAGMWDEVVAALKAIEQASGKTLGDSANPLLVSCRSGAKFSMPGMMDTVLNIGLNDKTAEGMIALTDDPRFVYDSYRRLVQMYGCVVMGISEHPFEGLLSEYREKRGVEQDSDLTAEDFREITDKFKEIYQSETGSPFPDAPLDQLKLATEAVFKSWNGKRAFDYRNAANIAHDLGTAVNICTMVFGNMGENSGTGVATTRDVSSGEKVISGDYLTNAQGEDVVAGTRPTKEILDMKAEMPEAWAEFEKILGELELKYREVQDVEFTVERGRLWFLQTRDSKRTAIAAVKIAVDLVSEGLINREEAVTRISPDHVDFFLHPQFVDTAKIEARKAGRLFTSGLEVSPGAAVGAVAFDADLAEEWGKSGKNVIMVRPETKPDDVHGMLAAQGILTCRGGKTSHAALVARQFGTPAVVGCTDIKLDLEARQMEVGGKLIKEGEVISLDGATGEVFVDSIETFSPELDNPNLLQILEWADELRRLQVWANADYPDDAERALKFGAQGIGLCRTEHMFFDPERLATVQEMILAKDVESRQVAIDKLLPLQRGDFAGLFRVMNGLPVIVRLLDPPLHEFLPSHEDLLVEVTELRVRGNDPDLLAEKQELLHTVEGLREVNPMLGLRGVRLGIHWPEVTRMQVRAIIEAACDVAAEGIDVHPEVMIPLTSHVNELAVQQAELETVAKLVMEEKGRTIKYKFGTMIEMPRAALTADEMAKYAEFFSYGTNDLTQTTFGISRDDAEASFLIEYQEKGVLPANPFDTLDQEGVGQLITMGVEKGRKTRPGMEIGICGEHGGDPASIDFCHRAGLNYVSCSPFRVPIARLAAAHAAITHG